MASGPPEKLDHGIFDASRPPSLALAETCVHCGMCLTTCPTYALWGQEMDSPRGRIHLIKLGLEGEVVMDETFRRHFDACLGCMACTTACPSGVQYEPLLELTRAQIERGLARPVLDRAFRAMLLTVVPNRHLMRGAAMAGWLFQRLGIRRLLSATRLWKRLPARLRALEALLPDLSLGDITKSMKRQWPSEGKSRLRVGLVAGCVQSVLFRQVNLATARVLAAEGCEVVVPPRAGCCGALCVHAGADDRARQQARQMIEAFERANVDRIVINAAGCGSTLKHYDRLFADEDAPDWPARAAAFTKKVCDVMELLDQLEPRCTRHPVPLKVAYHDACHLSHAQGIRTAPRRVLRAIPRLELIEIPEGELCCGSAGIYNLTQPESADELGQRKAGNIRSVKPDVVTAANPGCLLQLRTHLASDDVRVLHPIEVIALSLGTS